MSKKIEGVILDSTAPYGVGLYVDDRARMKYQTLMQDYHELQKEVGMMRSRLEAGKQRKMMLAAEVRFLRKRFGYFVKTKTMNLSQKEKLVQPQNLRKQTKHAKVISRREADPDMLPPIPEVKRKKKQYISKQVALSGESPLSQHHRKMMDGSATVNHKGRVTHANDTTPSIGFDLNLGDSSSGKELCKPRRPPIFDLNEISTGDEDFQTNAESVKFEEARRSLIRVPNEEMRNELMLSVRRSGGEGGARVGKRKISWQDPVALRV